MGKKMVVDAPLFAISRTGDDGDFLECSADVVHRVASIQRELEYNVGELFTPESLHTKKKMDRDLAFGLRAGGFAVVMMLLFNVLVMSAIYIPFWASSVIVALIVGCIYLMMPKGSIQYFINGEGKTNDVNAPPSHDGVNRLKVINGSDLWRIKIPRSVEEGMGKVLQQKTPGLSARKTRYLMIVSLIVAGLHDSRLSLSTAQLLERIMLLKENPIDGVQYIVDTSLHAIAYDKQEGQET